MNADQEARPFVTRSYIGAIGKSSVMADRPFCSEPVRIYHAYPVNTPNVTSTR